MKVKCKFCAHEKNGLCTKKLRDGNPTSVKVNKKRDCPSYSEDALRVLTDYRKAERHKAVLKGQAQRRAQVDAVMSQLRAQAARARSEDK